MLPLNNHLNHIYHIQTFLGEDQQTPTVPPLSLSVWYSYVRYEALSISSRHPKNPLWCGGSGSHLPDQLTNENCMWLLKQWNCVSPAESHAKVFWKVGSLDLVTLFDLTLKSQNNLLTDQPSKGLRATSISGLKYLPAAVYSELAIPPRQCSSYTCSIVSNRLCHVPRLKERI